MLREIFFGSKNTYLANNDSLVDAEPREVYIISCLLVPIIGIGLYPRLVTDSYRSSIEMLVAKNITVIKNPTVPLIRNFVLAPALLHVSIDAPNTDQFQ